MIDVIVVSSIAGGIALVTSVCFYNIRRSRCVRCKGCGCELEREIMSAESLKNDELKLPMAL
jgi:hypothetical protein